MTPAPANIRRCSSVAAAIALVAILAAGLVWDSAWAESRSSTTVNGRTIAVVGGNSQSISSTGRQTVVKLDGREIVIRDGRIEMDDAIHEVGDFTRLEIRAEAGQFHILVDGRTIEMGAP